MGDGRNSSSWLPWQQTTCLLHISSAALPSPPPSPSLHSQLTPADQYAHFSLSPSPQQGFAVINAFISGFTMMGPFPNRGEGSGGGDTTHHCLTYSQSISEKGSLSTKSSCSRDHISSCNSAHKRDKVHLFVSSGARLGRPRCFRKNVISLFQKMLYHHNQTGLCFMSVLSDWYIAYLC